jgi:glycosyltransferase involved in cell wall biosynthesis
MNETADPLVSVVIPTFNHASYLGRTLQSVLDQTYTNWEAIVIDNHSTDKTDEVMTSFADPRIIYLKIHNNGVIAASRNLGIRTAKGEWIAFLDSDDWWVVDKLQVCFDSINDKVDLIYHDLGIVSDQPRLFSRKTSKSWQVKPPVLMDLLLKGNAITNSSVVVRKRFLERIGGINESVGMISSEDYNTWLRIAQFTEQFVYLPRRLGYYLIHNQNASQKDMSVPDRWAVSEFVPNLSTQQKLKLEANLIYTKGRFNYLEGNYVESKEDLWFTLRNGNLVARIKAVMMLIS